MVAPLITEPVFNLWLGSKKTPLYNGAIECRLFEFKMVAGSKRKP